MKTSEYLNQKIRLYSLYVCQSRALPLLSDGLKAGARRVLWTARNGKKYKSATLSGATMPIHPHAAPDTAINTLAGPYGNNIPLLHGLGAFGTLLNPTAYGATRYTSVTLSEFTKDVVLRDIEIIPMTKNYDGTLDEPLHFLPLIPTVLLNPQEGIAVGFASNILPRSLPDIVDSQILHLQGKKIKDVPVTFTPTGNVSTGRIEDDSGKVRWLFSGEFTTVNSTTLKITNLPYGITHTKFLAKLSKLEETGSIREIVDNSKNTYNIEIKFKRGFLKSLSDEQIKQKIGLVSKIPENMNVVDLNGEMILSTDYKTAVQSFSEWRLEWFKDRYIRLANLLELDIQRYRDILTAISNNVGGIAKDVNSRSELKEFLKEIGVVHLEYIVDLPIYRFTIQEKDKIQHKLDEALVLMVKYQDLISQDGLRRDQYIKELREIKARHKKGSYTEA